MQLVAGIVQLLIFQHLALLMARAKPLNDVSSLYTYASKCNGSITSIMSQIHSLIMDMHLKAKERFDTYADCQNFHSVDISTVCHAQHHEFFTFSVNSTSSEEEKLSELYKIFQYMNTAVGNITQDQMNLNPRNRILHLQLNTSKTEIAAVISNLSCVLGKRYNVPKVDVYYNVSAKQKTMEKKKKGCKVLRKYKHFLKKAAEITSDWEMKVEDTQEPSTR
ncbi:leukemia inhibitory factor [Anomaloglossus baeobatrachus]|uniref:leukemia inhibitory factor n=1 Tax=Anomaloglossus baeobatrachus TaxID=238106 RepID=UPI003F5018A2